MWRKLRQTSEYLFKRASLHEIASEELYQAEVARLALLTAREYTNGLIAYRESQISRLKAYIQALETK